MDLAYRTYRLLTHTLFIGGYPFLWLSSRVPSRFGNNIRQRLGAYPRGAVDSIAGAPRIWIHAASVGEVRVALAVIEALNRLRPGLGIILSASTPQGLALAQSQKTPANLATLFSPLDFAPLTRRALKLVKPELLVFIETEIWPNWLAEAQKMGIKTAFVNGRISDRAVKRYVRFRSLFIPALKKTAAFSMINGQDAKRIQELGAPAERIKINGNAKFDISLRQTDPECRDKMRRLYNLAGDEPVLIAGSTRTKEPEYVIDAYLQIARTLPETVLLIAPRHLQRVIQIETLLKERGLVYQLRTGLNRAGTTRAASVVIIDTIGELQETYSIASIVFCGGSLVPLGGQNLIEPAAWGKPVLFGPSMENFRDARDLIANAGGAFQVNVAKDLAEKALYYLTHPAEAQKAGQKAQQAVLANRGAAARHAAVIEKLLSSH